MNPEPPPPDQPDAGRDASASGPPAAAADADALLGHELTGAAAEAALPFVRAVAAQLARTADRRETGSEPEGQAFAGDALEILRAARDAAPDAAAVAVERLSTDAPLLAAVFQNIDLLYQHGYAHADGVAALVMSALARLDERAGARLEGALPARPAPAPPQHEAPAPEVSGDRE